MSYTLRNSPTVDNGSGDLVVVANYVWDTGALDWVTAVGSTASGTNVNVTNASLTVTGTVAVTSATLATSAKQDTGNTSLATLAGAVAGTEVQADVLTMPAITGTVTANAGTNLNTSALATESTLSTLDGKVTACNTGAVVVSSGAITVSATNLDVRDLVHTADSVRIGDGTDLALVSAAGALLVDASATTQPVSGTVTGNPATYYGKTITYVSVAQGAAGTTELAAASASNKHKIIGGMLTMSLAGTLKFNDGTVDLTGPMTFAANGGMVVPESPVPFCETAATNRPMNLITTVGNANGVIAILTEA